MVFCELLAYMTSTTLTRPNSCSVQGCTSSRICGASNDSVLLALMTSEVPPSMARVVIFTAFRNFCCKREKFGNILFYRYEQTAFFIQRAKSYYKDSDVIIAQQAFLMNGKCSKTDENKCILLQQISPKT